MSCRRSLFILLGALLIASRCTLSAQDKLPAPPDVRISTTVSTRALVTAVGRAIGAAGGPHIIVSSNLTSANTLEDIAQSKADIAFITKPLSGEDRARYPEVEYFGTAVGMQVVALGVSSDLWDAGLHAITEDATRDIYEQKITNWKTVGGPDEKIELFSFEEGAGIWEILADWLYGDARKAPIPNVQKNSNSQDARDALEFGAGTIALMGAGLVDNSRCHALSITISGTAVPPTAAMVASGAYPLVRPLIAVSVGRPVNAIRQVTEFLASPAGQALIKADGSLGLDAVPKPPEDSAKKSDYY
jgi:phosphate transport system substrate-binding protein